MTIFDYANPPMVEQTENLAIYRAVSDPSAIGIGPNNEVVCGIRLECVYVQGYDCLAVTSATPAWTPSSTCLNRA